MRSFLFWPSLALLIFNSAVSAHWIDDPRYPDWAQRGRIIYLDGVEPNELTLQLLEQFKSEGGTPFIHAFTPHWPNDKAIVDRVRALGIPVDVRVESSNFFESDNIDRFAFVHGEFRPGGWWYNHAWRTNFDWYRLWPESMLGTIRKRNGDELLEYEWNRVTNRRAGAPLSAEYRKVRGYQIAWLLSGVDPLPNVPMRSYENRDAKDPNNPYPMAGQYSGLWCDNPSSTPSYDIASRVAWEKHFQQKFGEPIWDPPSHPDASVRREWARFWADAWIDYFRWRKQYQVELVKKRGLPFAFASGNFSAVAMPQGTVWFYAFKHGIMDMLGPSEYDPNSFNRGRFHFLIKTALAASHGRPAGKFYPSDLNIAESLAVGGCNTYKPDAARFLAGNADLYGNTQPAGCIAILFHTEQNLVESQLVNLQELVDQITNMGWPYEVVIEDDLGASLAREISLLIVANTDFTRDEIGKLKEYTKAGGRLLLTGDCVVEKPRHYNLKSPPAWTPDVTVASQLDGAERGHIIVNPRQALSSATLREVIGNLDVQDFRLSQPDPNVFLNVLRQPKSNVTLVGLVNYSGEVKKDIAIQIPPSGQKSHVGWISRDGGAGMLDMRDGRVVLPELRYGCTVLLGDDRAVIETRVKKNAERFPLLPVPTGKRFEAVQYGTNFAQRVSFDNIPAGQTLCRHCVGASDRRGYLILDVTAPQKSRSGEMASVGIHVLESGYTHVEYWQLILENALTGERFTAPIPLPNDNPHGDQARLTGSTLTANWTPTKAGLYQAYLSYRVVSITADGEPFLEPPTSYAGYSGKTPANLFLKGKPLQKRLYEDRLRGLRIEVK